MKRGPDFPDPSGAMLLHVKARNLWRRWAVATVFAALALGVAVDLPLRSRHRMVPAWAVHLAPLRAAPLPVGRPVSLIFPPALGRADVSKLLMETVWQRPEVDWIPATGFPSGSGPRDVLLVAPDGGLQSPPQGWARVWEDGWVHLFRRNVP